MKDILGRFLFVLWVLDGILVPVFAISGAGDAAVIVFASLFLSPIPIVLVYMVIKWIITGSSE